MTDLIERRKDKRCYIPAVALNYRRIGAAVDVFKGSLVHNLSVSGAKVTINEFLPANVKLVIELFLPGRAGYIQGGSKVAWVNKKPFNEQYEIGMQFDALTRADHELLAEFIPVKGEFSRRGPWQGL